MGLKAEVLNVSFVVDEDRDIRAQEMKYMRDGRADIGITGNFYALISTPSSALAVSFFRGLRALRNM
jgi:hypothetical protein